MSMNKSICHKMYKAVDISVKLQTIRDEVTQVMSGPTNCPETSLRNYHYTLRNIPEDCRSEGDTMTMVTNCTVQKHFLSRQAPSGSSHLHAVCLTHLLLSKPLTDLQAIRSHTFEGHLQAFSFNPHQTAITTWRTSARLPNV